MSIELPEIEYSPSRDEKGVTMGIVAKIPWVQSDEYGNKGLFFRKEEYTLKNASDNIENAQNDISKQEAVIAENQAVLDKIEEFRLEDVPFEEETEGGEDPPAE